MAPLLSQAGCWWPASASQRRSGVFSVSTRPGPWRSCPSEGSPTFAHACGTSAPGSATSRANTVAGDFIWADEFVQRRHQVELEAASRLTDGACVELGIAGLRLSPVLWRYGPEL